MVKYSIMDDDQAQNATRESGFLVITDLENAQQVTLDTKKLKALLKIMDALDKNEFTEIVLTVQKGCPIIIGGKNRNWISSSMGKGIIIFFG